MAKKRPAKQTLTRSVRFSSMDEIVAIERKAKSLGMSVSHYLRVCAKAGAGFPNDAIIQTAALVRDVESVVGSGA